MDSVSAVTLYINMQVRGNPLFCTEQPSSRVVDMVFNQPCQANCPAYPRYNQYSGRSGFTSFSGLQRLETKSTNLCSTQQYLGPLRDRPVCQPIDQAKQLPKFVRSYESAWNKWNSWCVEHHCDPFSPSLPAVLNFLCAQFQAGHAYRSLNVYR